MKLSKFYSLLSAYANIAIKRKGDTLYRGTVKNLPDEFDGLTVLDFNCTDDGPEFRFTFCVR